ncbi:type IV secretion system protein [Lysobacter enzymogenes]|uniref:type IV secretion system protein n=1 Tax=Lysobacter enzymogenes TaxID=69 RepID=UPI001A97296D|nr:type IV secretion system protein [Lysobacter enzymogenes]QQP97410.1 type IV secretion system protein [Lysobacter enzymogenes]
MDIHTVSLGTGSLLDWLDLHVQLQNMEFFSLIKDHVDKMIMKFQGALLKRVAQVIGAVVASVVTIWIIIQGFRIVTGQSREPMMGLVVSSLKSVLIVGIAVTAATTASSNYHTLTDGLSGVVRNVVTGRTDDGPYEDMDKVLGILQAGLDLVGSVKVGDDPMVNDTKNRAMTMIGVGLGGPVIMAMIAMLLNKIAMALFIGLGPFFILCLLFEQTKALFQRWLFYGIATMMSMAVLIVMTTISIDLVLAVGGAFWATDLLGLTNSNESMMSLALQQGGLGTILSALIVTAPPMAGAFFNGVLGSFNPYNSFQGEAGAFGKAAERQQARSTSYTPTYTPPQQAPGQPGGPGSANKLG